MKKFDYTEAISELEQLAVKVEDPSTGVGDIDKYLARAEELVEKCHAYLRTVREKVDGIDK